MHTETIQQLRSIAATHDDTVPIAKALLLDLLYFYEKGISGSPWIPSTETMPETLVPVPAVIEDSPVSPCASEDAPLIREDGSDDDFIRFHHQVMQEMLNEESPTPPAPARPPPPSRTSALHRDHPAGSAISSAASHPARSCTSENRIRFSGKWRPYRRSYHRTTRDQTKTAPLRNNPHKSPQIPMNHPPFRSEGSNPSLSATTQGPGLRDQRDQSSLISTTSLEGLGVFALPLTREEFVQQGFMRDHGPQAIAGGMHCYSVTQAGFEAVKRDSPRPPAMTRRKAKAKARMAAFRRLRDVCPGLTFPEFLSSALRERLELEELAHL